MGHEQKEATQAPPAGEGQVQAREQEGGEETAAEVERLKAEVEALREQAARKDEEARRNHENYLRERAELENFKKRAERELAENVRCANEGLLKDLLPVVDNLGRAIEHSEEAEKDDPLAQGVKLVLRSFIEVLERHGLEPLEALGETFDPTRHQAAATVETAEHAPNTVVAEHHKGYFLRGRLLRPAMVTVAKEPVKANGKG